MTGPSSSVRVVGVSRFAPLAWACTALVVGLGALHLVFVVALGFEPDDGLLRVMDLDGETTLPAWYASLLYSAAACLLLLAGALERERPALRAFWGLLAALMAYMSLDESTQLHEQSREVALDLGVSADVFLHANYTWLFFGVPAAALVALVFAPMLRMVGRRTAALFCLAGTLVVVGAMGMEVVGALLVHVAEADNAWYRLAVVVEEGLELAGVTLFLTTVYGHIARRHGAVEIRLAPAGAGPTGDAADRGT